MAKLSVIIPSYNCKFVSKTVHDIFNKASGDIEIIVVLDNYWPDPPIPDHKDLIVIHKGQTTGMRNSINMGARIATGEFIMKVDDHCSFSQGFDEALKAHSEPHTISIPQRYSLDVINWIPIRKAVAYEYATYPYVYLDRFRYGTGLVAKKYVGDDGIHVENTGFHEYYKKEYEREQILIDEIMVFHGSCWFMPKDHFFSIDCLDEDHFETLYQEPQELSFKTWLSGGRVIVNKHCWYAHMFKGPDFGPEKNIRGYRLNLTAMRRTERFGTTYWMNDCWHKAEKPMEWLIEKFWPIPGWPENWRDEKKVFEEKYLREEMARCLEIKLKRSGAQ